MTSINVTKMLTLKELVTSKVAEIKHLVHAIINANESDFDKLDKLTQTQRRLEGLCSVKSVRKKEFSPS